MHFKQLSIIIISFFLIMLSGCNKSKSPTESNDDNIIPGWEEKTSMSNAQFGSASCVLNGKIHILGGTQELGDLGLSTVNEYNLSSDSWKSVTPLITNRLYLSACVVNDKIYAIGGTQGLFDTVLNNVEEYDPDTDSWINKTIMPTPRGTSVSGVIDSKIFVISGRTGFKDSTGVTYPKTNVVEMYDPVTDMWETKAPIPNPRVHICGAVVAGKIYVFGGNTSWGKIVEVYDPVSNSWSRKTDMPGNGRFASAAAVINDKIYIIGGSYGGANSPRATVYEYNTTLDSWNQLPDIPVEITESNVEVINNKIYIIAGATGLFPYIPISTVYEYDPLTYTGE